MRRGQKRAFTAAELERLRSLIAHEPRQRAILGTAVDTMLRSSDLLSLRLGTVRDASGAIRESFGVGQRKDFNRTVIVSLTPKTREALALYIEHARLYGDAKLFPICSRTLQRMVQAWARSLDRPPNIIQPTALGAPKPLISTTRRRIFAGCNG